MPGAMRNVLLHPLRSVPSHCLWRKQEPLRGVSNQLALVELGVRRFQLPAGAAAEEVWAGCAGQKTASGKHAGGGHAVVTNACWREGIVCSDHPFHELPDEGPGDVGRPDAEVTRHFLLLERLDQIPGPGSHQEDIDILLLSI